MHVIEEDLKRQGCPIMFKRLLAEGLFACSAFAFYNGLSPSNAYAGRQPQKAPDFNGLGLPEPKTTGQERENTIREIVVGAIAQATAVAKVNRALRAKTRADGGRLFKVGDLADYHRPTTAKDDHGGWN